MRSSSQRRVASSNSSRQSQAAGAVASPREARLAAARSRRDASGRPANNASRRATRCTADARLRILRVPSSSREPACRLAAVYSMLVGRADVRDVVEQRARSAAQAAALQFAQVVVEPLRASRRVRGKHHRVEEVELAREPLLDDDAHLGRVCGLEELIGARRRIARDRYAACTGNAPAAMSNATGTSLPT